MFLQLSTFVLLKTGRTFIHFSVVFIQFTETFSSDYIPVFMTRHPDVMGGGSKLHNTALNTLIKRYNKETES